MCFSHGYAHTGSMTALCWNQVSVVFKMLTVYILRKLELSKVKAKIQMNSSHQFLDTIESQIQTEMGLPTISCLWRDIAKLFLKG